MTEHFLDGGQSSQFPDLGFLHIKTIHWRTVFVCVVAGQAQIVEPRVFASLIIWLPHARKMKYSERSKREK